ncbi:hypothetical protein CPB86DRAFT_355806 [Serendipita vermifera]|nr:hypothetical protein CPB86DRAFT_355806 [Serendipita vermifera]
MPSFGSAPIATGSAAATHNGTVRTTIISYARAILPSSLPAAFYDFVPFILAGMMALLFTALLVLLVEDSEDVYPHSPRSSSSNGLKASKGRSSDRKGRIVGLAEHHQEELDEEAEEWDRNAWNPRADLANASNTRQSQQWLRIQQEKSLANINPTLASYPYRTSPKLFTTPPSSAAPDSPAFSPPILSMAKMIMHRHDQYSKRPRSPSRASPPPSPPSSGGNGNTSFKTMQYTLKSASIRSDKLALVAFPEEEMPELIPLPPSRSPSPPSSPTAMTAPTSQPPLSPEQPSGTSSHTRASSHSRSRALALSPALDSLGLPSLPSVKNLSPTISSFKGMAPSLPSPLKAITPALQMLSSQKSQDRSIRRRPSGLLEEGGSSADLECQGNDTNTTSSSSTSHSHASNSRKPKRRSRKTSHKRSDQLNPDSLSFLSERTEAMHSNDATKKRGSDLLADLEEGSHGRAR